MNRRVKIILIAWASLLAIAALPGVGVLWLQSDAGGAAVARFVASQIRERSGLEPRIESVNVLLLNRAIEARKIVFEWVEDGDRGGRLRLAIDSARFEFSVFSFFTSTRRFSEVEIRRLSYTPPSGFRTHSGPSEDLERIWFESLLVRDLALSPQRSESGLRVGPLVVAEAPAFFASDGKDPRESLCTSFSSAAIRKLEILFQNRTGVEGADVRLQKSGDGYRFNVDIPTARLSVGRPETVVLAGSAEGVLDRDSLKIDRISVRGEKSGSIGFSGTVRPPKSASDQLSVEGSMRAAVKLEELARIWNDPPDVRGDFAFEGKLASAGGPPSLEGRADLRRFAVGTRPFDDMNGDLVWKPGAVSLKGFRVRTAGAEGDVAIDVSPSDWKIRGEVRNGAFALHEIFGGENAGENHWALSLLGGMRFEGGFGNEPRFKVTCSFDAPRPALPAEAFGTAGSVNLDSARIEGTAEITPDRVAVEAGRVVVGGADISLAGSRFGFGDGDDALLRMESARAPYRLFAPFVGVELAGEGPLKIEMEKGDDGTRITGVIAGKSFSIENRKPHPK